MKYRKLLLVQIIIGMVLDVAALISNYDPKNQVFYIINLVILLINAFLYLLKFNSGKFLHARQTISVLSLNYALLSIYNLLFMTLGYDLPIYASIINLLWAIGYIFVPLPNTIVNYGNIKNSWLRFLSVLVINASYLVSGNVVISKNQFWQYFNSSMVIAALGLLLIMLLLLHQWGYRFKPNLKAISLSKWQVVISFLLAFYIVWYCCVGVFSTLQESINFINVLTHFDFSLINPFESFKYKSIVEIILSAVQAGVFEELYRYLMIVALAAALAKNKLQLPLVIIISTVIFGIGHYSGFLFGYETFVNASRQAIEAVGGGFIYALVFLYSGKIWLSMVAHAGYDFLAFSITPLAYINTESLIASSEFWLGAGISVGIAAILFLFFMLTQQRTRLQYNLDQLLSKYPQN